VKYSSLVDIIIYAHYSGRITLLTNNWIHIFEIFTILLVLFAVYRIFSGFNSERKLEKLKKSAEKKQRKAKAMTHSDEPVAKETALNDYIGDFFSSK